MAGAHAVSRLTATLGGRSSQGTYLGESCPLNTPIVPRIESSSLAWSTDICLAVDLLLLNGTPTTRCRRRECSHGDRCGPIARPGLQANVKCVCSLPSFEDQMFRPPTLRWLLEEEGGL
ncbi:hypothetical protein BN1723_011740 [Verticillium longisporum]|uniref:Uncharacterized protein n=1 Tax=Verticillium longisporum TaxID=100787 RepID=A0A0G4LAB3_VERLO|nr:hypothetical protein BN1723_011740 [Verticillium longisporum]